MISDIMPTILQATVNLGKSGITKDQESNRKSINSICYLSVLWKTLLISTSIHNTFKGRISNLISNPICCNISGNNPFLVGPGAVMTNSTSLY